MAKVSVKNVFKIYPGEKGGTSRRSKTLASRSQIASSSCSSGPRGCGKSTTLRMIAGLEEISQGDIFIGEKRVNDVAPKDRDIAMVFQNYALYPHMSVYDNLAFGLKLRKFSKTEIKKRVLDAASILGIENAARSQTEGALRRAAAARRSRPGDRAAAEGFSLRRAALQSRRQDAGADADGNHQAPSAPAGDDDLRHRTTRLRR